MSETGEGPEVPQWLKELLAQKGVDASTLDPDVIEWATQNGPEGVEKLIAGGPKQEKSDWRGGSSTSDMEGLLGKVQGAAENNMGWDKTAPKEWRQTSGGIKDDPASWVHHEEQAAWDQIEKAIDEDLEKGRNT